MDFDQYGLYGDDGDHRIDLRNPHFRQEPYHHMQHHHSHRDLYAAAHAQHNPYAAHHLAGLAVDVKPRLTKEQHDVLETHYCEQSKPNTQTKKTFAETLGVSLDKVNNWFQNRRAKSKQDAKKQAGNCNMMPNNGSTQQPLPQQQNRMNDDMASQYLSPEYFGNMNDSAVSVDPSTLMNGNALGIRPVEQNQHFGPTTMSPRDMMAVKNENGNEVDVNRRTLTQDDFNSFAHPGDYIPNKPSESTVHDSPAQSSFLTEFFPELGEFNFDTQVHNENLSSSEMQPAFSNDSYGTATTTQSDAPSGSTVDSNAPTGTRNLSKQSSVSDWSEHSTPSLSITPAAHADSGYAASDCDISPRAKVPVKTSGQWQPGQSVPVDFDAIDREFREAAMRSASKGVSHTRRSPSLGLGEQPMAFPSDQAYAKGENQACLAQSIGNLGINNDIPPMPTARAPSSISGGIAARRQRPRPQPLSSTSLRSASYCGSLPNVPGASSHSSIAPPVPTLRRIKSSNVMNGHANGRIQKSIGAQRSPLNFSFAEAMNSPKFARSVSNYSPAHSALLTSTSLAPPTPLSPSELPTRLDLQRQWAQLQGGQQMSRQQSINESLDRDTQMMQSTTVPSNSFSSPPTTPLYGAQFARMGNGMMNESTPPQSAPASQQFFANGMNGMYSQPAVHQAQNPMMQSQQQAYMPMMTQEYPQMPNVVSPSMQLPNGQYVDLNAHYAAMGMMPPSASMQVFTGMPYAQGINTQSLTPPHHSYAMVPSSPGVLLSSQSHHHQQQKPMQQAEFFVHEYCPPSNVKRDSSPRKTADNAPKNYTFANHGPEHFEKSKHGSKGDITSSPGSSTGGSSTG